MALNNDARLAQLERQSARQNSILVALVAERYGVGNGMDLDTVRQLKHQGLIAVGEIVREMATPQPPPLETRGATAA